MNDQEIVIRRAESPADYRACQEAQRLAWGIVDDSYIVPIATMVGAQLHGGLVLGAFLADGRAVGLSFAFLGKSDGEICLYSQLTGVVPGYQDKGLGYRLKIAQREFAHSEYIPSIAWAFDPLQGGNARFNLNKLGATARHYYIDMYGPRTDALNRDTPTDRLIARWATSRDSRSHAEFSPEEIQEAPRIIDPVRPVYIGVPHDWPRRILLEIPSDIKSLRERYPATAEAWLRAVRQGFLDAFDAGYQAVGVHREESMEQRRDYYILTRRD